MSANAAEQTLAVGPEFYLGGLKDMYSQQVYKFRPWESSEVLVEDKPVKLTYYTAIFGKLESMRVCAENRPCVIKGFVLDYDSPWKEEYLESLKATRIPPTFVSVSRSGNFHLVWLYGGRLNVSRRARWAEELNRQFMDLWHTLWNVPIRADAASVRPSQIFAHIGRWIYVAHPDACKAGLEDLYLQVEKRRLSPYWKESGLTIQEAYEILKGLKAFRWHSSFEEGQRGPSWWLAGSDSSDSAIITEQGMISFSSFATKPAYTWEEVVTMTAQLGGETVNFVSAANKKPVKNDSKKKPAGNPLSTDEEEGDSELNEERIARAVDNLYYVTNAYTDEQAFYILDGMELIKISPRTPKYQLKILLSEHFGTRSAENNVVLAQVYQKADDLVYGFSLPGYPPGILFEASQSGAVTVFNIWHRSKLPVLRTSNAPIEYGIRFPTIAMCLEKTFPDVQNRKYLLTWLAQYYKALVNLAPTPGYILMVCGGSSVGKSFITEHILGRLFGGVEHAGMNLTSASHARRFNISYAQPLIFIDDVTQIQPFSVETKQIVNRYIIEELLPAVKTCRVPFQLKRVPISLPWMGRVVVVANPSGRSSGPASLLKDAAAQQFISCISTGQHVWKLTPTERAQTNSRIREEIPYFAEWLLSVNLHMFAPEFIDEDSAYEIKSFKEPQLLSRLPDSELEMLKELVSNIVYEPYVNSGGKPIRMTVTELLRKVNDDQAMRFGFSRNPYVFYTLLKRLSAIYPNTFREVRSNVFEISPGPTTEVAEVPAESDGLAEGDDPGPVI